MFGGEMETVLTLSSAPTGAGQRLHGAQASPQGCLGMGYAWRSKCSGHWAPASLRPSPPLSGRVLSVQLLKGFASRRCRRAPRRGRALPKCTRGLRAPTTQNPGREVAGSPELLALMKKGHVGNAAVPTVGLGSWEAALSGDGDVARNSNSDRPQLRNLEVSAREGPPREETSSRLLAFHSCPNCGANGTWPRPRSGLARSHVHILARRPALFPPSLVRRAGAGGPPTEASLGVPEPDTAPRCGEAPGRPRCRDGARLPRSPASARTRGAPPRTGAFPGVCGAGRWSRPCPVQRARSLETAVARAAARVISARPPGAGASPRAGASPPRPHPAVCTSPRAREASPAAAF